MKRIVLFLVVASAWCLIPTPSSAQEQAESGTRGMPKRSTTQIQYPPHTFRLEHADCFEVAKMLDHIMRGAMAQPIQRGNCVVYAGPEETLEAVRKLVKELDVPVMDSDRGNVEIVRLMHREANELASQLAQVMRNKDFRVAADENTSSLILRGSGYAIQSALDFINRLDQPAAGVSLEFAFFHADLGEDENQGTIPEDLADVAKELRRFGGLRLIGRLSSVATEHEDFVIEGTISQNVMARIAAKVNGVSAEGTMKISLKAEMTLDRDREQSVGGGKFDKNEEWPSFELATMVTARRGDYVVLGSAPTGWGPGESAILVMHVRP